MIHRRHRLGLRGRDRPPVHQATAGRPPLLRWSWAAPFAALAALVACSWAAAPAHACPNGQPAGASATTPVARAACTYYLAFPVTSRSASGIVEQGFRGPRFIVTGHGATSSDSYNCPPGQAAVGYVVVPDDLASADVSTTGSGPYLGPPNPPATPRQMSIDVTNWSSATARFRLAASCSNNPLSPPFYGPNTRRDFLPDGWLDYWDAQLDLYRHSSPPAEAYGQFIPRVFCWAPTWPGCASTATASGNTLVASPRAQKGGNTFALRNGTNELSLSFRHPARTRRPPTVRLAGAHGCRALRLVVRVMNGSGWMKLRLRCKGVRRGAKARVTVGRWIVRNFHLRRGAGSVRVRLAKPSGSVEPLTHVSYGRKDVPCQSVRHRLRLASGTLDLRVSARCGRAAGNATGHLYLGGLVLG